ncbi:MAG: extracellular solute-binding protein [Butyrivibrio sp.]|nr:extracellular solute-binding protein [Butyrivibrio sp.]
MLRKRISAVILSSIFTLNIVGCAKTETNVSDAAVGFTSSILASTEGASDEKEEESDQRVIRIGTWYDHGFDSNDLEVYLESGSTAEEGSVDAIRYAKMQEIEEKYNVKIEFVKYSFDYIKDSIMNANDDEVPECDIYEIDYSFGIPAATSGFAANLKRFVSEDDDIFNDQSVFMPVQIGSDDGVYLFASTSAANTMDNSYVLAFNKQLLEKNGLENPNELYDRGEWTWDKWLEYMNVLTQDTNADGTTDVYGFGSRYDLLLSLLCMSNGTNIAASESENISSDEVGECLEFMNQMYNIDKVTYPWNEASFDSNVSYYLTERVGFWISSTWISSMNSDRNLAFDVVWCPFPIGPSGNVETNYTKNISVGTGWMIPENVDNPEFVYSVFEDWCNWYEGDLELRDGDLSWYIENSITDDNYNLLHELGQKGIFDPWNALDIDYHLYEFIKGEYSASDIQNMNIGLVQTALDELYNKE